MRKMIALVSVGVPLLVAGCGGSDENTKSVSVAVSGNNDSVINRNAGIERCAYGDGELATGDRVTLRGADETIVGVSKLEAAQVFRDSLDDENAVTGFCAWNANFDGIKADQPAYTVEIVGYGKIAVSPEELDRNPLELEPRSSIGALFTDEILKVKEPS